MMNPLNKNVDQNCDYDVILYTIFVNMSIVAIILSELFSMGDLITGKKISD